MSIANKALTLRTILRQQRRALSARQQQQAARNISRHLQQFWPLKRARRIAYYRANDGEISPQAIVDILQRRDCTAYLPVLHPLKYPRLYFSQHHRLAKLCRNRFDIAEPQLGRNPLAAVWTLDIILLPLVGFDRHGNRLGMGGGFYDRTLARLPHNHMKRPLLIGLAHHCQEIERLPTQSWDIPLDIIVTDKELIRINKR